MDVQNIYNGRMSQRIAAVKSLSALAKAGMCCLILVSREILKFFAGISLGADLPGFYELVYAPASKISCI